MIGNLSPIKVKRLILYLFLVLTFHFLGGCDFAYKNQAQNTNDSVYTFSPTKYNRLTGFNLPDNYTAFNKLTLRLCKGETAPLTILIAPNYSLSNIKIKWGNFEHDKSKFNANQMDVSVAKVWYQAGVSLKEVDNKVLTQELLVKNDSLVCVDRDSKTNYLLVKEPDGKRKYINISDPNGKFPPNVYLTDSKTLLPFSIKSGMNKQIWFSIHIPENIKQGKYISNVEITSDKGIIKDFPIEVTVLPFNLAPSRIIYGIYYHGHLTNNPPQFSYDKKSKQQLKIELKDMLEHGIRYPTCYQKFDKIDTELLIRDSIGFPKDKFFVLGIQTGNPQAEFQLNELNQNINKWLQEIKNYHIKELYIYGIDEAKGDKLTSESKAWQVVHHAGARVFVAVYKQAINLVGGLLDIAVMNGKMDKHVAQEWHSYGGKIFSYANPQVGMENPEIYRRNYGLALWKAGCVRRPT